MIQDFAHLHVHTQYSLLDGAADVKKLIAYTKEQQMSAIAITDHGNMFGVKSFYEEAIKNGIKPILGCEVYVAKRSHLKKDERIDKSGWHLVLLAKNKQGYHNLMKLVSISYLDGQYYRPRVDKALLRQYSQGLIASTACLGGEVPRKIINEGEESALEAIREYKEIFGDDFYLEVMDHGLPEQKQVNEFIFRHADALGVKVIATNDSHFIKADDAQAHDVLVCLATGKDFYDPNRMRYTGKEWVKNPAEMWEIFGHTEQGRQALANTLEVANKVETFKLNRSILLPAFPLPSPFDNQDDYLRHLTYEGAKAAHRYPVMTDEIRQRLDYELDVIKNMGFAGYFLIVQDFIAAARNMGVAVGPGRGSAAGSAVAFCVGITNVDPIKYKLLFERFLNPERISMPDVDIDFDDDGRGEVMEWVVQKYGADRVAQIITYGTMAAKSSIKDVARVLKLPLPESDRLSKLVPEGPKVTLKKSFEEVDELKKELEKGDELVRKTLKMAQKLEGSIRQTGVHACGVIIGPEALMEHIPLSTAKDSPLPVTQYDGKEVENVGMLKMDFLGLKTLSIIKDAIANIKLSKGLELNTDTIPLDDPVTFGLYQRGDTVGTFQFESDGMRKYLRELKPTNLEDLFAMNALYRPGPMDFIPVFIRRKHGLEPTEYPHPMLEELLRDTYGIMIYQEQIMQAAQIMGGFSLGGADLLRRAMGKKKADEMAKQKAVFVDGAIQKGVTREDAENVFGVMEKFASYGFNRSHSAAYSIVAYYTGYLKANFPAEYIAAVLSRNLADIKKITTFMDEAKRMKLQVLGPDVNESYARFTVNKKGEVRFGMAAIKGVGEAAVDTIIKERKQNGSFRDIFDFVQRVNLQTVNKKNLEALAMSGAFDSFGIPRAAYFADDADGANFIEHLIRFANKLKTQGGSGPSLFGDLVKIDIAKPEIPRVKEWAKLEMLNKEKDLVGIFLSAHPLDDFRLEMQFASHSMADLENLDELINKEVKVAGMVTSVEHRNTKAGKAFGTMTVEDYQGAYKFVFFDKNYSAFREYMLEGNTLYITGKVQQHPFRDNELEYKINTINYLADIKDLKVKSIAIKVSIDDISEDLVAEIESIATSFKGNTDLEFLIWDPTSKLWVKMFSRNYKVNINDELLKRLDNRPELSYKIF